MYVCMYVCVCWSRKTQRACSMCVYVSHVCNEHILFVGAHPGEKAVDRLYAVYVWEDMCFGLALNMAHLCVVQTDNRTNANVPCTLQYCIVWWLVDAAGIYVIMYLFWNMYVCLHKSDGLGLWCREPKSLPWLICKLIFFLKEAAIHFTAYAYSSPRVDASKRTHTHDHVRVSFHFFS